MVENHDATLLTMVKLCSKIEKVGVLWWPSVRIPGFHCCDLGSIPDQGMAWPKKKKKARKSIKYFRFYLVESILCKSILILKKLVLFFWNIDVYRTLEKS